MMKIYILIRVWNSPLSSTLY